MPAASPFVALRLPLFEKAPSPASARFNLPSAFRCRALAVRTPASSDDPGAAACSCPSSFPRRQPLRIPALQRCSHDFDAFQYPARVLGACDMENAASTSLARRAAFPLLLLSHPFCFLEFKPSAFPNPRLPLPNHSHLNIYRCRRVRPGSLHAPSTSALSYPHTSDPPGAPNTSVPRLPECAIPPVLL
jgi:hypothetical protein